MRRVLLLLLKVGVSGLLLYLSLRSVHLGAVGARLASMKLPWLAAAAAFMLAQTMFLATRWRAIADAANARLGFSAALQFTFIGAFFSQVLPSTIGGDAARIWLLAGRTGAWAFAAYSVLVDRIVGVTALGVVVIACLPWSLTIFHDPTARVALVLLGFGVVGAAGIFLTLGLLPSSLATRLAVVRHLSSASRMALRLCRSPRSSLVLAATSLPVHFSTVAMAWCCARAIAAPVGFAEVLFILPPVLLVATAPVSIAGWGLRESSMVVAFGYAGLAQSDGLAVSILFGVVSFAVSAAGGVVWIATGLGSVPFVAGNGVLPHTEQARS